MPSGEITVKDLDVRYKKNRQRGLRISHRFGALYKFDQAESSSCHMEAQQRRHILS